ncbi:MAG: leucyl aminopeptidase family protein [Rhodospirillaceae bacterium]|nr:leucyl aminopeptidase family protein [Rhodospirillaceae bacterium]
MIASQKNDVPIHAVSGEKYEAWLAGQTPRIRSWLAAVNFKTDAGATAAVPGDDGAFAMVVLGLGRGDDPWVTGRLAIDLPKGNYRLASGGGSSAAGATAAFPTWAALAWALGGYSFARYKSDPTPPRATLAWPEGCDRAYVEQAVTASTLARDLINTPAADMLPDALEEAARTLARLHGAQIAVITGEALLAQNYPMIHAVGRASAVAPRLIDFSWGGASAPRVTLVGKGVCFDTGGLDLKSASGMALMKKDMGGAATVLGLAHMIMAARLPVRLRVLVPAVENAVAGNAFRPGDVLKTRKGITVEIGNTDAEGRLVLADALTAAVADEPSLLVDCATLTGACRTALGPDLPGLFVEDDALAADLLAAATAAHDPLWRLPLFQPYRKMIDSKVADINNAGDSPFAGAITAALFLKEFVGAGVPWVHIDSYAWNPTDRPGRPAGGEALAQRALFGLIQARFGAG